MAVGDTALSQIENPASLTLQPRRLDFAGQLGFPVATWRGPLETVETRKKLIPLASIGFAQPLSDHTTFGLAVHSKAGLGTDYRMRHLLIPWMRRKVGSDMKCLDLQANLGHRLSERWSIGGGVRLGLVQAEFSTVLGPADVDFGAGRTLGAGFQFGVMHRPRDDLTLGFAYRSPTWAGDLKGGQGKASLFGLLPIELGGISMPDTSFPQRLAAGAAWDVTQRLKLVGEARWVNYSATSLNSGQIRTNGLVNLSVPWNLGYRDQWALTAGLEYRLAAHWVAGLGYHFATAPLSPDHLLPVGSIISQHHVTTGLRYEAQGWWVGGGYVCALPTRLAGRGNSAFPLGIDYAFSEIEQAQHLVQVGFGFNW